MISVFSGNAELREMLSIEVQHCGETAVTTTDSPIWLLDLDAIPAKLSIPSEEKVLIGFSKEEKSAFKGREIDFLFSLPYDTVKLHEVLTRVIYHTNGAEVQFFSHAIFMSGKKVRLSATEEKIFRYLYEHKDEVVNSSELYTLLGLEEGADNLLAAFIYKLRKKLAFDGHSRIRSERGIGYRLAL